MRISFRASSQLMTLLLGLLAAIAAPSKIAAQELEFELFQPNEVDCSQASNQQGVQVPTGVQTTLEFCQARAGVRSQQILDTALPWGATYWVGESICRDRSDGGETVCLSPAAADNLRWPAP